ncbi:DUF7638 domain-containing protein [Paenibacillus terrae]
MQKMYRNKRVEGTRIPGIIHNGSYFLTPIDVYEDGMVNCWDLVDLAGLIGKLESGWIVTDIPEGEHLSIFHLGYFKVTDAHWQFDAQAYYEYIVKVIKQLNPDFSNIDMHIKLQGGKTASEKCEDAYHAYLIYPSDYTRERLKEAYEQVPEHLRMYLGDMDNRDTDYIRIIYHPDEKREV